MLIGITDVMQLLGVGRYTAERIARQYLGKKRIKGQKYLLPKEDFLAWVNGGMR